MNFRPQDVVGGRLRHQTLEDRNQMWDGQAERQQKPVGTALAAGRFQNSDCRGQRSEAVQAYTVETVCLQSLSAAKTIKILLNPVGAGLKCPPEQSTVIKQLVSVRKTIILFYAVTNYKIRLSCGRAQRPAPTTTEFIFPAQPRLRANFPIPHLISNV